MRKKYVHFALFFMTDKYSVINAKSANFIEFFFTFPQKRKKKLNKNKQQLLLATIQLRHSYNNIFSIFFGIPSELPIK